MSKVLPFQPRSTARAPAGRRAVCSFPDGHLLTDFIGAGDRRHANPRVDVCLLHEPADHPLVRLAKASARVMEWGRRALFAGVEVDRVQMSVLDSEEEDAAGAARRYRRAR